MLFGSTKSMITIQELTKGHKLSELSKEVRDSILILLDKGNQLRTYYNKPMIINRGYSSSEDQIRIYKEIAEKKGIPFDQTKVPMGSEHIKGGAMDVSDPHQELQKYILANLPLMEKIGLWFEDFSATPTWVHCQVRPYGSWKSGKSRFFKP